MEPGPQSIPYEILRRADGAVALSANAGEIEFSPTCVVVENNDLLLRGSAGPSLQVVRLRDVPADVHLVLQKTSKVPFLAFTGAGRYLPSMLELVS